MRFHSPSHPQGCSQKTTPIPSQSEPIVLDEYELAAYWKISVKTVRRWRRELLGPAFCKVGTRSVYPLSEIEAFERRMSRNATSLRAYR